MLYSSTVKRVTKLCIQSAVDCNQLYLDHWTNISINQYIYSRFSSLQYFVSFASNVINYIWNTGPISPYLQYPLTNDVSKFFLSYLILIIVHLLSHWSRTPVQVGRRKDPRRKLYFIFKFFFWQTLGKLMIECL